MGVEDFRVRIMAQEGFGELVRCASTVPGLSWREAERSVAGVFAEVGDGKHLLEVEVQPWGVLVRFSVCHEDSVDQLFVPYVLSVARCGRGLIRIDEDLPANEPGEYRDAYEGFEADYLRAVQSKRMVWDLNFRGRRNGLRCGEALQYFIR